jgi:ferric-dicitrate binding protein FerR (iron transport regulator)
MSRAGNDRPFAPPDFVVRPRKVAVAEDLSRRVQLSFDGARGPAPRGPLIPSPIAARATTLSWAGMRPWQWPMFAALALGALSIAWLSWPRPVPMALPLPMPMPAPEPPTPPKTVHFADGSSAQLHGERSAVFTEEDSVEHVRARVSGGARFDVVPDRERSFVVANAQVTVRVLLGTAFSIDPEGPRTRVALESGRVQVMWRSGAAIMSAGEAGVFPPLNEPAFVPAAVYDSAPLEAKHKKKARRHKARAR